MAHFSIGPFYAEIVSTRSAVTDTDFASASVTVTDAAGKTTQYGSQTYSLGDLGPSAPGATKILPISYPFVDVPDGGELDFAFTIVNQGASVTTAQAMKVTDDLANALVGGLLSGALASAGVVPGTPVNFVIAGGLVLAAGAVEGIKVGLDLLTADCDGVVAMEAGKLPRATIDANTQTIDGWVWQETYPGADSPAGCGANSLYKVAYSIRPVVILAPECKVLADLVDSLKSEIQGVSDDLNGATADERRALVQRMRGIQVELRNAEINFDTCMQRHPPTRT